MITEEHKAGESAIQMAEQLEKGSSRLRFRPFLALCIFAPCSLIAGTTPNQTLGWVIFVVACAIIAVYCWTRGPVETEDSRRWRYGAGVEKRVGALLDRIVASMNRRKETAKVFHDVRIKGWTGNIDHLLICRYGIFIIDSKGRSRRAVIAQREFKGKDGKKQKSWFIGNEVFPLAKALGAVNGIDGRPGIRSVLGVEAVHLTWCIEGPEIPTVRFGGGKAVPGVAFIKQEVSLCSPSAKSGKSSLQKLIESRKEAFTNAEVEALIELARTELI